MVAVITATVGPLAGVFADRWDQRHSMLWMDAIRACSVMLLLPVAAGATRFIATNGDAAAWSQIGIVYVVVALTTAASQLFNSSRITIIRDIVPRGDQPRASGFSQIAMTVSILVGPPLAAPLFFAAGPQGALLFNVASFGISFFAILAVRVPPVTMQEESSGEQSGVLRELRAGLEMYMRNQVLRALLVTLSIVMLGAGALNALEIFFVRQNLHASAQLYGWLGFAQGLGAVAGAAGASVVAKRIGVPRLFWTSTVTLGLLLIFYSRLTSFAVALPTLFVAGVPMAAVNVAAQPLLLQATPRAYLGRAVAVLNPAISIVSIVSIAVAGWLVSVILHGFHARVAGLQFGPIDTVFLAAGVLFVVAGIYAKAQMVSPSTPASVIQSEVGAGETPVS